MNSLPPWANGPFELIVHAEIHLQSGDDFDRRISLISFDNAIEVAITTFLTLNPIQRGGLKYSSNDVDRWTKNYHTKLEFFGTELSSRKLSWSVKKSHIIWAHEHRNEQYHGGLKGTPEMDVLRIARDAALWIFSVLYDLRDPEAALEKAVLEKAPHAPPIREKNIDVAIDDQYGIIHVGEHSYHASELLFAADYSSLPGSGWKADR